MPTKEVSHIIKEEINKEITRRQNSGTTATGSSSVVTGAPAGGFTNDPTGGGGGVIDTGGSLSPEGFEYSTDPPTAEYEHSSPSARFDNLDEYVGVPFVAAMNGATGHTHSGDDGDGPPIPPENIALTGAVGSHTNLLQHVQDSSIHGGSRAIVFDDFESADQSSRWTTLAGTPVREVDGDGNTRWRLPYNTLVRLASPGYSWNDRFTFSCDVLYDATAGDRTLDVRFRVRDTNSNYSYIARFSASEASSLRQRNHSNQNVAVAPNTGFQMPNDSEWRRIELVVDGTSVRMLGNGSQFANTIPGADEHLEGYFELFSPGGNIWVDNVLLTRNSSTNVAAHGSQHETGGADPLDVKDLDDSLGLLTGGAPGAHAATHNSGGIDVLDVNNLDDSLGRLLTGSQRALLVSGSNADSLHTHAGAAVPLSSDDPLPNGLEADSGASTDVSRADHVHVQPYYTLEYYVTLAVGTNYIADAVDIDTSPYDDVRTMYRGTIGGEFHFTTYGNGLLFRARLKIVNSSGSNRAITLYVPVLKGNLRIRSNSPTNGDQTLYSSAADNLTLAQDVVLNCPAGETTTLSIYGTHDGSGDLCFWVAPETGNLFDPALGLAFEAA